MFFFFSLFSSFAILSSFFVVISNNPVYSVLFLVLSFFNVSSLLFILSFELLPVIFIVVYVGAIAVLFLFVIMTLSVKLSEIKAEDFHFFPALSLLIIIFLLNVVFLTNLEFTPIALSLNDSLINDFSIMSYSLLNYSITFIQCNNIRTIGYILFTEFSFHFIFIGMVLLFAMIASIILTLQKSFISKSQNAFIQNLRNFNSTIFLYT